MFNFHSIINNGFNFGGQNATKRRTLFFCLQETFPYCIPKVVPMKIGEVIFEKLYMSRRLPSKISFKHDWKRELGSEVARQPEEEVSRQAKTFQPTQPTLNPIRERSERLDIMQDRRKMSRSQEIDVNSFCEEPSSSERTVRLVETNVIQTRSSANSKSLNVEQTNERTGRLVVT